MLDIKERKTEIKQSEMISASALEVLLREWYLTHVQEPASLGDLLGEVAE